MLESVTVAKEIHGREVGRLHEEQDGHDTYRQGAMKEEVEKLCGTSYRTINSQNEKRRILLSIISLTRHDPPFTTTT